MPMVVEFKNLKDFQFHSFSEYNIYQVVIELDNKTLSLSFW